MTSDIVSVEIGRSTWQGPAEEAPQRAHITQDDLVSALEQIEMLTATGSGLDPDTTMQVHLLAGIGRATHDRYAWYSRSDLCASGQQVRALEWSPIKTAPKDGSWFLGTSTAWNNDVVIVGWHFGAWREDAEPEGADYTLTHWMPLPSAPSAALTPAPQAEGQVRVLDVDDLAQIIRVVDGNNTLGAGELAEAVLEAMPVPRIVGALTPAPQHEGQVREAAHRILELYDEALRWLLDPGVHDAHPDSNEMAELRRIVGAPAHRWTPASTPATPTAQEAVPVGWRPISEAAPGTRALVKYSSGLIDYCYLTDWDCPIKNAWRYAGTAEHGRHAGWPDSFVTIADLEAALTAHPPQPSETVSEAQIDAIAVALSKRIYNQTEGEWQPSVRQADELARAALRALKGGSNG